MPKNIVVFSDGAGQDGGTRPKQRISNIYKMYRILRDRTDAGIDRAQQAVSYDAGLGTDAGAIALIHQSSLIDLAIATIRPR